MWRDIEIFSAFFPLSIHSNNCGFNKTNSWILHKKYMCTAVLSEVEFFNQTTIIVDELASFEINIVNSE